MRANADLRRLVWGNAVSTFGTSLYLVAVLLLLKEMTQSAFVLGLFQFVALSPAFLLSPVVGVLVDRYSRRRIMILADCIRGVVMVGGAAMLTVPSLRTPWAVLVVSAVVGTGNAFFVPAAQALIPDIVSRDRLQAANGLRAASNQGFNLAGNALGGILYATLGAALVFLVNGVTFLLSALQELRIRADRDRERVAVRESGPGRPARSGIFLEARRGLALVARDRVARTLLVSQAGLFVVSPALLLALPFIVIDELSYGNSAVGIFFATSLAGGIAVFLVLSRVTVDRVLRFPVVPAAYGAIALVFAVLSVRTSVGALAVAALVFGAAAGAVHLYAVTWVQGRNDSGSHGRLFALLEAGNALVAPISYVLTGLVLEVLGRDHRHLLFLLMGGLALVWAVRTGLPRK